MATVDHPPVSVVDVLLEAAAERDGVPTPIRVLVLLEGEDDYRVAIDELHAGGPISHNVTRIGLAKAPFRQREEDGS